MRKPTRTARRTLLPRGLLRLLVLAAMLIMTKHDVFLFVVFVGYALSGPVRRLIVGRAPASALAELPGREHA